MVFAEVRCPPQGYLLRSKRTLLDPALGCALVCLYLYISVCVCAREKFRFKTVLSDCAWISVKGGRGAGVGRSREDET